MFQFTPFPSLSYVLAQGYIRIAVCGFPHSDICGSMDMCSSPQLFAAYHVLLRLPVPRHPPDALVNLTIQSRRAFRELRRLCRQARRSHTLSITRSSLTGVPRISSKIARAWFVAHISVNMGLFTTIVSVSEFLVSQQIVLMNRYPLFK